MQSGAVSVGAGGVYAMHAFSVHLEREAPVSMLRGMCVGLQSLVGQ